MPQLSKKLNIFYGAIHGTYWMYFGVLGSFASVFLLAKGYSNSQIGIILAVAYILATVVQPFLAELADRGKKGAIFGIIEGITGLNLVFSTLMIFLPGQSMLLTISFVLCYALMMANQPFVNAVNGRLEETGVRIAFGTCRSFGSLAYSLLCYFLGIVVEKRGPDFLPIFGNLMLVLVMLVVYSTYRSYKGAIGRGSKPTSSGNNSTSASVPGSVANSAADAPDRTVDNKTEAEVISLKDFVKSNKLFFVMSLGIMGLYFANAVPNTYIAQISGAVGGDSSDVGKILALLAITEIPTLVLFDKLYQRFRTSSMLKVASVAYVLWIGAHMMAKSVGMLLGAQFLYFMAFPLFLPAMVRFIDDNMRPGEAVKGQTLFTVMINIGNMASSIIGGIILDVAGPKSLLIVATGMATFGAMMIILMVDKAGQSKSKN